MLCVILFALSGMVDAGWVDTGGAGPAGRPSSVGTVMEERPVLAGNAVLADLSACPKLRIAIINQITSHYEVLLGLVHLFEPHAQQTDVYIHELTTAARGTGAWDLLRTYRTNFVFLNETTRAHFNSSTSSASAKSPAAPSYDMVVLVSPEYHKVEMAAMLRSMRPRLTVLYVHNVVLVHQESLAEFVVAATEGGGEVKLVTLSPHTSQMLSSLAGGDVDWVLASYPFRPHRGCEGVPDADLLGGCLRGFCIQGTLEGSRRGYGQLWSQMQRHRSDLTAGAAAQLFHVTVMGKGSSRACGVPEDLQQHVTVSTHVPFPAFYDVIHHSLAIMPALNNVSYFQSKFTSSVVSSLITGTPLIANRTFLEAYGMLSGESVYLQADGEPEVDAMLRVLNMPTAQIRAVRRGLLEARRRVNERAVAFYGALLARLCGGGGGGGGEQVAVGSRQLWKWSPLRARKMAGRAIAPLRV